MMRSSIKAIIASPVVLLVMTWLSTAVLRADEEWKFDILNLKNGRTLQGMLVSKSPTEIRFSCVSRKPGSHTVVIATTLAPAEIASMELLDDADHEILARRLKSLDPTGKGEAERMANLVLKPLVWGKDGKGLRFESTHFVLESNAPEDVVRRAAVRLEEIYAAYARFLPPRVEAAQPTRILLARSLADYETLLKEQNLKFLNPAFFDVARNLIVCGSELQTLGEQLELVRQEHLVLQQKIKDGETKLGEMFPKGAPADYLQPFKNARLKIDQQTRQNDEAFQQASKQLFRPLYHEAFHAYLANFVYPPEENEVPRWSNEGLAQIFESAFVEAGELRIGHADLARLPGVQMALRTKELAPLNELLVSGKDQFIVRHATDKQTSDRYYLTSWAGAFYLTFERRLLGTRAMDDYVKSLKRGNDPVLAFEKLTGQSVAAFEKDFHQYLSVLRPDGTIPKK